MVRAVSRAARTAAGPAPVRWVEGSTTHGAKARAGRPSTWQRVSRACRPAAVGGGGEDGQPVDPRMRVCPQGVDLTSTERTATAVAERRHMLVGSGPGPAPDLGTPAR